MLNLDDAIRRRHSTRMFLPRNRCRGSMDEALALAQCAPSNSDIQPWQIYLVSGARRDRFVAALTEEAKRRPPKIPPLPASFQHFRSELGEQVYGAMGRSRGHGETYSRGLAQLGVLPRAASLHCLHAPGPQPVGCHECREFVETFLLALTERGLGSCVEVSVVGYPEIVRAELDIPEELLILSGLAVGYADPISPPTS